MSALSLTLRRFAGMRSDAASARALAALRFGLLIAGIGFLARQLNPVVGLGALMTSLLVSRVGIGLVSAPPRRHCHPMPRTHADRRGIRGHQHHLRQLGGAIGSPAAGGLLQPTPEASPPLPPPRKPSWRPRGHAHGRPRLLCDRPAGGRTQPS